MPKRDGSGRKKAPFSSLFNEVASTGKLPCVICTFCSKKLAKAGSRMKKHLQQCPKCPLSVKTKYLCKVKDLDNVPEVPDNMTSAVSLAPVQSLKNTKSKQPILSFVDKISETDQLKANELLSRAIYASGTPLSIVENTYWQQFFKFIRPALKLPSRYQISVPLLQQEYTNVHASVEEKIAQADSVGIMCDGWSNIRNESIVNFVVVTPAPLLYKILATGKQSHTAEYMAKEIKAVVNKIGIQKVFGVVTDNAANMKAAWAILEEDTEKGNLNLFTYGCLAHSLDLIFSDVKKLPTLQTFLAHAVLLIKTIRQSHLILAAFKEKQNKDNAISLKLPVVTRWGSVVYCFESLQANKQAILSLAIEDSLQEMIKKHPTFKKNALDDTFWDKVDGFISLLKPVANAIKFLEADKTRISLVIKIFKELEEHFLKFLPICPLLKHEEAKAIQIIRDRKDFAIRDVHKICNLLDPSIRGSDLTPSEQTDALEKIFTTAQRCPDVDEKQVLTDLANFQAKAGFFSKAFLWVSASEISPTAWWKGFCSSTELSKLAARFLELPATSAACERSFSTYGGVHTAKRNRLKNDRAAKLVYISHNLKLGSQIDNSEADATAITSNNGNVALLQMPKGDFSASNLPSTSGLAPTVEPATTRIIHTEDSDSEENSSYSLHDTDTSEGPEDFESMSIMSFSDQEFK